MKPRNKRTRRKAPASVFVYFAYFVVPHLPSKPPLPVLGPQLLYLPPFLLRFEDALLDPTRAFRVLPPLLRHGRPLRRADLGALLFDGVEQPLPGELAVEGLRARILHRDGHAGRHMAQRHRGRDLVHMLPAGTGAAGETLVEICGVEFQLREARSFSRVKIGR